MCARVDRLPADFLARLDAEGIRAGTIDPGTVRFVTHKDVDDADLERVLKALSAIATTGRESAMARVLITGCSTGFGRAARSSSPSAATR